MERWPSDKHRLAYTTSLLLFQYCLPLLLVLLCYLRIFLRLRRRRYFDFLCITLSFVLFLGCSIYILSACLRFGVIFHSELSDNRHHAVLMQGHAGAQQEDSGSPED